MPAKEISLSNASHNKLFYFVANVVVYRDVDKKCLLLKRSENEKVHPGKYCVPGGKLEWNELLLREVKEETGLLIHNKLCYINSVGFIRPDGIPVVLTKFAARYKAGDVVLEKGSFTDHAWVDDSDVGEYDCIQGIAQEIQEAIAMFK